MPSRSEFFAPTVPDLSGTLISAEFCARDVVEVARDLLGCVLARRTREGVAAGRIVEVEAYLSSGDTAAHSFRGRTPRNASIFGPPGRAYVYAIHSRWCLNVVTEEVGRGSAVLIRAIEPLRGVPLMQRRRKCEKLRDLARGPARLCEALHIDRRLDGWSLGRGERLWITRQVKCQPLRIAATTRIGVTSAKGLPLRFINADSPYVTRPRLPHHG